jgi:hypothetical protein
VNPDGTPYTTGGAAKSVARSITAEQEDALINYYEIITRIQDKADESGGFTGPVPSELFSRVAAAKTQGWASVPVEVGYRYQVLLLEGWKDVKGGDPVLLRSAFGVSDAIVPGVNTVTLTVQNIQVSPRDHSDEEAGYRFFIQADDVANAKRPDYDGTNGNAMTVNLPLSPGLTTIPSPKMTIAVEGAIPLMLAKAADIAIPGAFDITNIAVANTVLANTTVATDFFDADTESYAVQITRGINMPQTSEDNQQVSAQWKRKLTTDTIGSGLLDPVAGTLTGTGKPGRILFTVTLPTGAGTGTLNSFLMAQNGNGSFFFDARYYGFSKSDGKTRGFTRWAIRNGLNYLYYDRKDNVNGNYTGGAVAIKFGEGNGSINQDDQATVLEVESGSVLLTSKATVALSGVGSNGLGWTITPSHPAADEYRLFYSTTQGQGASGTAVSVPATLSGVQTPLAGGTLYYFTVQTVTNGAVVASYETSLRAGSPIIDLSGISATTAGGLGWTYDNGTKTVTISDGANVTLTGTTTSTFVVASGAATITLDGATIDFSAATGDRKALRLTGATVIKLKSGTTSTIKCKGITSPPTHSASGAGIEVPSGASLEIQGPGALNVYGLGTTDGSPSAVAIGWWGAGGSGPVTITGGTLYIEGGRSPAIGAVGSSGGNITITGGNITASAGGSSAAVSGVFGSTDYAYSNAISISGNPVLSIQISPSSSAKAFGSGNNNGTTGNISITGSPVIMISTVDSTHKAFNFPASGLNTATMQGIVRYGSAWHVYGTPTLLNYSLTIPSGQVMDFYPIPTGLDSSTRVPTASLGSSSSTPSQILTVGSGAVLINQGTINRHGAGAIATDGNGQYHNSGNDNP